MLAQVLPAGWSLGSLLIAILIAGGVVAVFYVIITYGLGWKIPPWVAMIFWICVAVLIGVVAIKFLLSLF